MLLLLYSSPPTLAACVLHLVPIHVFGTFIHPSTFYLTIVGIYSEFVGGERSDRTDRMEVEQQDEEGATRLEELEQINADLQEQNQDLKEQTTRLQVCTSSSHTCICESITVSYKCIGVQK